MKRMVSSFFLLLLAFNASGQYGHEWIAYNQPYFKIPVAEEGIYRISYGTLQEAGVQMSADPQTFQIFHRGMEQAIMVRGAEDGIFDTSDYIEFYGKGNDGALDSTLYANPADQPHGLYNLFSDTTSYFLTYGPDNGKRISTSAEASTGLMPQTYHMAEKLLILKESYFAGTDYGNIHKSAFDAAEGWMGVQILQNQEVTYTLEGIVEAVEDAGKPHIEILLTGRGPMAHNVELYAGGRLVGIVQFQGFESHKHEQKIEWFDIDVNGILSLKVRVTGAGGSDRVSVGYIRLRYPQALTMTGVTERMFHLPETMEGLSFIRIASPPPGLRLFDVTEASNVVQIQGQLSSSLDAVVPDATTPRKIMATANTRSPAAIRKVSFRRIDPALHNYVIITHRSLRKPALGYVDPVKAYAEYRRLPQGGGFDTLIINIDQLYDQFNYGEASPRAIFQFMKFFTSVQLPDYLFLVGKGLTVNYGYHRNPSVFTLYKDLVPTAGYPASDMAYTAGLSGIPEVAAVATGRLTATTPADVAAYLNKVKQRDVLPFDDLGRKKILHLSGGIEDYEPILFRGIMEGFESIAEDVYLGGQVEAIAKASTGVKVVNIAEKVNQGLGMITFFGHSAPNTLDFDIGLVSDPVMGYDNAEKYPFLLMNGCDVGSFFLNTNIFGENWIKTPNKGAIGFIAHSSYGKISALQRYTATFYKVAFGDSVFIQKGVGKVQREVAKRYVEAFGISPEAVSQVQQMVLLGDPAVKIFGAGQPDLAIDEKAIFVSSFNGEAVTALTDSFRLHIPVKNFGIGGDEDIRLEVRRTYHDGAVLQYDSIFPFVLFNDTLTLVMRNADAKGFGMNSFSITVDAGDRVDELDETNNTVGYEYFIPLNSTRNLYPYNFSIVQSPQVDLSFQHTDLLSGSREYLVEIDTTHTFDSGYKQHFVVNTEVLGRHRVELLSADSVVYFWRTKIADPLESESKDWTVSSFSYLSNGPEGWAQLRFAQYASNGGIGLTRDPELKRMEFKETVSDIAIKTFLASAGKPTDSVSLKINGVEFNLSREGSGCRNNTLNLVAFDKRSTQPYAGIDFKWYELLFEYGGRRLICGREPYIINSFRPQELITGNQDDLIQYIDNVKRGDSVVLFSIGDAGYSQWPGAAKTKLAELGISTAQLADLQDGDPAIIFGRKGAAAGTATIFHASAPQVSLKISKTITGRYSSGWMSSSVIGPARRWDQLMVHVTEVEPSDDFRFSIVGITADNETDTLKTNVSSSEDLSFINASEYPYLKIILAVADDVNVTSVQLRKWLVSYESVADGLVFYRGSGNQLEVLEGETVSEQFGFVNISDKTFSDSLTVRFDLLNRMDAGATEETVRISPPLPGDTTLFSLTFGTVSKTGLNDVEVFVNPEMELEKYYDNNRLVLREHVNVLGDHSAPVVAVTFDGRYLENHDFVTANPLITVRLWDDNPFIRKRDTLDVRIFLAYPCDEAVCGFERIYFSRNDVTWEPASEGSDFTVDFSPSLLIEGSYTLRVEASDSRGNDAGETPYEITFQVEDARSMRALPPYPNPFVEETNFDVIVTGTQPGSYAYDLQLTNISGELVTQLSNLSEAFGVGRNTIRWDGAGVDGIRLPKGIYFYRLFVSDGDSVREYAGKVVLLR